MTRSPRSRCRPRASVTVLPLSFSDSFRRVREICSAGARPNSTPLRSDASAVKANTPRSILISFSRGRFPGSSAGSASTPHCASSRPKAPPSAASTRLSVRSCRTRHQREAPSAARTAISFSRVAARDRSRLATLAIAISSTNPTATISISSAGRTSPTMNSFIGSAAKAQSDFCGSGQALRTSPCIATNSAPNCCGETPGLSLPTSR